MKKNDCTRFRSYALVCYNRNFIESFISDNSIKSYYWILHDKDKLDNGDLKPVHYHVVVTFNYAIIPKKFESICDAYIFLESEDTNYFYEPVNSLSAVLLYLTHRNDPDKFQYSFSLIYTNNLTYLSSVYSYDTTKENDAYNIVMALIDGVPYEELLKLYGRDFVFHYRQYLLMADLIEAERLGDPSSPRSNKYRHELILKKYGILFD